jgi:hypothetical protein
MAEFQSIGQQFTRLEENLDRFAAIYVETVGEHGQHTLAEREVTIPELDFLPWTQ